MSNIDLTHLMNELLNKDRFNYIEIIMKSDDGVKSIDIAEEILRSRGVTHPREIKKENIKVNKRLRKLVDLGILISDNKGGYNISSLGYLLLDSWKNITEKVETMEKFDDFFDNHSVEVIPKEFFRQMYKLRTAELTGNAAHWANMLGEQMGNMKRKLYNLTQYLHNFPKEIIEKKKTEKIDIVIIYQFNKYPKLNYLDEKKLFDKLVDANVEFRYINLEIRHPIGIRIVDEKWATFLLPKIPSGELDRDRVFYGTDQEFVSWCRDLMYHIWHFEAKPLNVDEVTAKEER